MNNPMNKPMNNTAGLSFKPDLEAVCCGEKRHNWTRLEVATLFDLPWLELAYRAHQVHRRFFNPSEVQVSTLLSIKTGACPEDCQYCSQSGHYNTELKKEPLMSLESVVQQAEEAKAAGASRFCMGAAWRSPPKKDMPKVVEMVRSVKALGLETCMTLGMLDQDQADELAAAGLDYYNHNLDTSEDHYNRIISTRSFEDRLQTLDHVRNAGINVCCGGILGLGESQHDRMGLLLALANLPEHPQSVPINQLVAIEGTPLASADPVDPFDFVRT